MTSWKRRRCREEKDAEPGEGDEGVRGDVEEEEEGKIMPRRGCQRTLWKSEK